MRMSNQPPKENAAAIRRGLTVWIDRADTGPGIKPRRTRSGFVGYDPRCRTPRHCRSCLVRGALIRYFSFPFSSPVSSTAKNAFCGMSTWPIDFIRFLPSFCFSHSLRLRLMSPP
jgi:hypothetical protein